MILSWLSKKNHRVINNVNVFVDVMNVWIVIDECVNCDYNCVWNNSKKNLKTTSLECLNTWFKSQSCSKDLEFKARKKLDEIIDDLLFDKYVIESIFFNDNDLSLLIMWNLNVLCSSLKDEI